MTTPHHEPIRVQRTSPLKRAPAVVEHLQAVYLRRRENFRAAFRLLGIHSSREMGEMVGVTHVTISAYLCGKLAIDESRARHIEDALRLPFGTLDEVQP